MGKAGNLPLAKIAYELRVEEPANLYGSRSYRRVPSPCEPPLMSQFVFYAVHVARVVVECKCVLLSRLLRRSRKFDTSVQTIV